MMSTQGVPLHAMPVYQREEVSGFFRTCMVSPSIELSGLLYCKLTNLYFNFIYNTHSNFCVCTSVSITNLWQDVHKCEVS